MKKFVALLLVATFAFTLTSCKKDETNTGTTTPPSTTNETTNTTTEPSTQTETAPVTDDGFTYFPLEAQADVLASVPKATPAGSLVMGSTTTLDKYFLSGWTNASTNQDIKRLIGGYDNVVWTKESQFLPNPVAVKSFGYKLNDDGTKTYKTTINENLVWNDGSKITAKDYVFYLLLSNSPEIGALEADNFTSSDLVGFEEFQGGSSKNFKGIRLVDEYTFTVTAKAESLPYYYDITFASAAPLPMDVIAPGCDIVDSEDGATISGPFTQELIQETLLNDNTGYAYKPLKTAGPYNFVQYDPSNNSATVKANPNFLGTYCGETAVIDEITIIKTTQATQMDELGTGSVNLLSGIASGTDITKGLDLADEGKVNYTSYPRSGYGKIAFHCDFGPTQFVAVRQAIAWCLDRDDFCKQFTSGYGIVVNGYYGASMREYTDNKELLDSTLINYTYNLDKAKELLIADGWVYNADGSAYTEGPENVRYKKLDDGTMMALQIEWLSTEGNAVSNLIATMLVPEAMKVGIKINQTIVDFDTLLANYNRKIAEEPKYHMYNLATGFSEITAVWYYYGTNPDYLGAYNSNFILDNELEAAALAMKSTEAGDFDTWSEKWVAFEQRWNYLLPDIPLYSNEYHDFYTTNMDNYNVTPVWSWSKAITSVTYNAQ